MKILKIFLVSLLVVYAGYAAYCASQISVSNKNTVIGAKEKLENLKVSADKVIKYKTIKEKGADVVKYYYAGKTVPAKTYKINGKDVKEDINKRTVDTETYCDGNDCVLKINLAETYVSSDLSVELLDATTTVDNFDKKLKGIEQNLGDTSTVSTSKTSRFQSGAWADTNYANTVLYLQGGGTNDVNRTTIGFTMPSGSGTISAVNLYLYAEQYDATTWEAHNMTRTNWTESCTWNKYDGTNNWTSAGGDYNATVVSHGTAAINSFNAIPLMGTGTDNPLTLNWGDAVNILMKKPSEATTATARFAGRENATTENRPYIEVTYTGSASAPVFYEPVINVIN